MLLAREVYLFTAGEDFVTAVLFIPFGKRGRHVHLLDDIAPAYPGIVCAERDLALLGCVRDDALLCAPEFALEQVLDPHDHDEYEGPADSSQLFSVRHGTIRRL